MILCGIDVGTSSIKVSIVDAANQQLIYSSSFPEVENEISSPQPGFAEQDPEHWWYCVKQAILKANATGLYDPKNIGAIGISYQMHGLVVVDKKAQMLRPSIIWCDSRATPYGEKAYKALGESFCQSHYLNSPGNFTAAKLAWVKENQRLYWTRYLVAKMHPERCAGKVARSGRIAPATPCFSLTSRRWVRCSSQLGDPQKSHWFQVAFYCAWG